MQLDVATMEWVATRRRPALTRFFRVVSFMGEGRSWFAVAALCNILHYTGYRTWISRTDFLRALLCPALAWLLGIVIKRVVSRARPTRAAELVQLLGRMPNDGSFPSSHASSATSLAVALAVAGHPLAVPIAIWAACVCASRIYLGVHYPSDVAGGIVLGALIGVGLPWGLATLGAVPG